MPDANTGTGSGEGAGAGTGAPAPQDDVTPGAGTGASAGSNAENPEVRKLRDENAQRRTQARELEAKITDLNKKLQAHEDAGKSEHQKAVDRAEAAEKQLAEVNAKIKVSELRESYADAASTAGATRPGAVAKLLLSEKIEFGETGEPKADSLKKAIERVKAEAPELFKPTVGGSDAGGGAGGRNAPLGGDMNAFIRRSAGRQS